MKTKKKKLKIFLAVCIPLAVLLLAALCAWLIWGNVKLINFSNTWSINHALAADPGDPITILAEADYKEYKFILYTDPVDAQEGYFHHQTLVKQPYFPNSYLTGGHGTFNGALMKAERVPDTEDTFFLYNMADSRTTWSVYEYDTAAGCYVQKLDELTTPSEPFVMVKTYALLDPEDAVLAYDCAYSLDEINAWWQSLQPIS